MNSNKIFGKSLGWLILALIAVVIMAAGPSFAVTYNLAAVEAEWTPPGSTTPISMWGFVEATTCPTTPDPWNMGPTLEVPAGDGTLTINLLNCLAEPVSIVIPGQGFPAVTGGIPAGTLTDGQGRERLTSFIAQAADSGGNVTYTWTNLKPGTFLYLSGSHPAKQVQMGLYGALKVYAADGEAYPGISPDNEVLLLYSEIDPKLHDPEPSVAQPLNYKPEYFLINGAPWPSAQPILTGPAITAGQEVLIRFLNAGLKTHVPTLLGDRISVIAEDGNLYPYPKDQYSMLLAAGKTMDALWNPTTVQTYPVYDASNHLTNAGVTGGGMLVHLVVESNQMLRTTSASVTTATVGEFYSYDINAALSTRFLMPFSLNNVYNFPFGSDTVRKRALGSGTGYALLFGLNSGFPIPFGINTGLFPTLNNILYYKEFPSLLFFR
jgi:FtsP/CotA-like multicopper oxidase with cupredoxin domain